MIVQEKIVESKHQKKQIAEVCTMYFFVEFHVLFGHARFFNEENMAVLHGQKNQTRMLCDMSREIFGLVRSEHFEFTNS